MQHLGVHCHDKTAHKRKLENNEYALGSNHMQKHSESCLRMPALNALTCASINLPIHAHELEHLLGLTLTYISLDQSEAYLEAGPTAARAVSANVESPMTMHMPGPCTRTRTSLHGNSRRHCWSRQKVSVLI